MIIFFNKTRLLISCLVFSVLAHFLFFYAARMFGTYNFTGPVNQPRGVMVDLADQRDAVSPAANPENRGSILTNHGEKDVNTPLPARQEDNDTPSVQPERGNVEPAQPDIPVSPSERVASATLNSETDSADPSDDFRNPVKPDTILPPLRTANEFLTTKYEKLTYQISMFGLPVGSAEIVAKNEKGEIRITLRVTSNAAISSIYPVEDSITTRHINGNFIITRIKQKEGLFKGDIGFTIFLREKSVFWIDLVKNRSLKETIPNSEALDTLSAFYFLRNRQLQIGKTETLPIYDSETYADVPVEILRREEIRLPNFKKVATLVVRPLQQTAGIFRRTGDVLIWMTDDAHKVPVRIVTTIALGKVTAELVSAESDPPEEGVAGKQLTQ
jgi:hypothetical protein